MQRGVRRRNSPLTHRPSHGLSCITSSACIARETRKATQKAAAVALGCSGDVEVVDRKLAATESAREARHTVVRGAQHVRLGGLLHERGLWIGPMLSRGSCSCSAVQRQPSWDGQLHTVIAGLHEKPSRSLVSSTTEVLLAECCCPHHLPLAAHRVCSLTHGDQELVD